MLYISWNLRPYLPQIPCNFVFSFPNVSVRHTWVGLAGAESSQNPGRCSCQWHVPRVYTSAALPCLLKEADSGNLHVWFACTWSFLRGRVPVGMFIYIFNGKDLLLWLSLVFLFFCSDYWSFYYLLCVCLSFCIFCKISPPPFCNNHYQILFFIMTAIKPYCRIAGKWGE